MRRLQLGLTLAGLTILMLGASYARAHADTRILRTDAPGAPRLVVVPANDTWQGKPVFILENESQAPLDHITIQSWSEQLLPVLWIGSSQQSSAIDRSLSVQAPPYNLPAGGQLWFTGPTEPPAKFSVAWLAGGHALYENLAVFAGGTHH